MGKICDLLDLILRKDNLNEAYKQVKRNKGKGGIDGMQVDELLPFLRENQETLIQEIREGRYKPNPVRRVEIPKEARSSHCCRQSNSTGNSTGTIANL